MAERSALDWRRALRRDGFTARGWGTFWGQAWRRARDTSSPFSPRGASTLLWISAAAVAGMLLLSLLPDIPLGAVATWGVWLAVVSAWVFYHQGLVVGPGGEPYDRFLLPNGLSFMRLGLAPLVAAPVLSQGNLEPRWLRLAFLVLIAFTDLADGQLARRLNQRSRLGAILDPLADVALLSWLAIGLYQVGVIMPLLLLLVVVRWPGALLFAMALYFFREAPPPTSSPLGKATTAITSVTLFGFAIATMLWPAWLATSPVQLAMDGLVLLLVASILAQGARALRGSAPPASTGISRVDRTEHPST